MTTKETIQEALRVYLSHCATQIVRKRTLSGRVPTWQQLKKIEEVRNVWKVKYDAAGTIVKRIDKGDLLGL